MRSLALAMAAAAGALAAAPALAADDSAGPAAPAPLTRAHAACPPPKGARVLARSAGAIVWQAGRSTLACWRPSHRVWALGPRGAVALPRIAGRRLAYGASAGGHAAVRVADLTAGSVTEAGPAVEDAAAPGRTRIAALVLRADGVAAWIGEALSGASVRVRQVRQAGGLMASGLDIDRTSLRLRGDRVAWRQAGFPRSAPLG